MEQTNKNTIIKIVVSMTVALIIMSVLALFLNLPFWEALRTTIFELGIFLIIPWLLIGSLVKKSFKILLLWSLIPSGIIEVSIYLSIMTEPLTYPPASFDIVSALMIGSILCVAGMLITSIGYGIQKMVDR